MTEKRRAGTTRRKKVAPAANEYANRFMFFINALISAKKFNSLNEFCEMTDYYVQSAYAFANGKRNQLPDHVLVALHKQYNLNLNWYFTGEGNMIYHNGN